jgi:hypothetical protein
MDHGSLIIANGHSYYSMCCWLVCQPGMLVSCTIKVLVPPG